MFILFLCLLQVKGVVLDKETKRAVIGASVADFKGRVGTYADLNGSFSLPPLSVGDSLVVSRIGYKPETLRIEEPFVRVYLEKSYVKISPVEVRAPPFERKLKTTGTVFTKEGFDVEALGWENPLKSISSYPGVVQGHIRGGRKEETLYTLDGAPIVDNIQREVAFELPVWSVSQMDLFTSDFEPEFGNVTSGLVLLNSKKMNLRRESRFIFRTDFLGNPLGESYRENRIGGFYSTTDAFFSIRGITSGDRFWDTWRGYYHYPIKKSLDFLGNKTFPLGEGFLLLQDISYLSEWREYEHLFKYSPGGLPERKRESHRLGFIYSGNFSKGLGLDLSLFDYILNYQVLGKDTRDYDLHYELDSLGYVLKGDKPVWTDHFQNRLFLKSKLNFVEKGYQGYFGFEANLYNLYVKEVQLYPEYIQGYNFVSFLTYLNDYHYRPNQEALFFSLKIKEGQDLMHFGLRYDRFDPRSYRPRVEIPPEYPPPDWVYEIKDSVRASPKDQLSPRFGLSHRSENVIIRMTFGYFYEIPQFQYLYSNPFYNFKRGYLPLFGNPDLKPSKTRLNEFSVTYLFNPEQNVSANLFYRQSSNLVDALRIMPDTASFTDLTTGFTLYGDVGTADVVGLEFAWEGNMPSFRWTLSYTLMRATGTFGTWLSEPTVLKGVLVEPGLQYPLSWDQTHTIALDLTYGNIENGFASLYLKWGSGLPYSPKGGYPNSKRMPPSLESTVKAGIRLGPALFSLVVNNPFNRRNVLWVDGDGAPGGKLKDPTAYSEGRRIWLEASILF